MTKRKPFSILKWLVFPSLTLALATIIAWFNVSAFGWQDGAVYIGVVAVITAFSIAINKYVKLSDDDDESNDRLAIAAFVFEIVLTLILGVNAAYSLSVQREMSVARQVETQQNQNLESVSKLKSRSAQREATKMLREQSQSARSVQTIFAENERPLFWIMVGEMIAYIIAAFTLYAFAQLIQRPSRRPATQKPDAQPIQMNYRGERSYVYLPDGRKRVTQSTYDPDEVGMIVDADYEFPSEIDDSQRASKRSSSLRQSRQDDSKIATVATVAYTSELKTLREHLREIALDYPMKWFRADLIEGGVLICMFTREKGREVTIAQTRQSEKLLKTVSLTDFRARLIDELTHQGFPIEKDKAGI